MNFITLKEILQMIIPAIIALSGVALQATINSKSIKQNKRIELIYKLYDRRIEAYIQLYDAIIHYVRLLEGYHDFYSLVYEEDDKKNIIKQLDHIIIVYQYREIYFNNDTITKFNEFKKIAQILNDKLQLYKNEFSNTEYNNNKVQILDKVDECLDIMRKSIGLEQINRDFYYK